MNMRIGLLGVLLLLINGCALAPLEQERHAFVAPDDRFAPVVIVSDYASAYNRVGRVEARRLNSGNIDLAINPDVPVVYVQRDSFSGPSKRRYRNFYYRLHFERVPFRLWPFNLTAGRNGGLLLVVTVDDADAIVLLTTVHTCGCYLAFIPTSAMPADAMPDNWPSERQAVYGETLPARLDLSATNDERLVVYVQSQTHRITHVAVSTANQLPPMTLHQMESLPMDALTRVPLDASNAVSFFHESGIKQGYVKYASKPFEFLLMSWWALDPFIGQDKMLGDPAQTGTVFYTSLKPWNRAASSLWPFDAFLRFWGWRL